MGAGIVGRLVTILSKLLVDPAGEFEAEFEADDLGMGRPLRRGRAEFEGLEVSPAEPGMLCSLEKKIERREN